MKRTSFLLLSACALILAVANATAAVAPNVVRATIAGIDVLIYRTGVRDVVTLKGNLPAGDAELTGAAPLGGAGLLDILGWSEEQWDAATRGSACRRSDRGRRKENPASTVSKRGSQ